MRRLMQWFEQCERNCANSNTKELNWFCNDKTKFEGMKTDKVTPQFGLKETVKNATDILDNLFSSIDLVFTPEPNLVMKFVV